MGLIENDGDWQNSLYPKPGNPCQIIQSQTKKTFNLKVGTLSYGLLIKYPRVKTVTNSKVSQNYLCVSLVYITRAALSVLFAILILPRLS